MSAIEQLQEFLKLNPWCSYLSVVVIGSSLYMAGKAAIKLEIIKAFVLLLAVALLCFVIQVLDIHTLALWVDADDDNAIIYWICFCAFESGIASLYYTQKPSTVAEPTPETTPAPPKNKTARPKEEKRR